MTEPTHIDPPPDDAAKPDADTRPNNNPGTDADSFADTINPNATGTTLPPAPPPLSFPDTSSRNADKPAGEPGWEGVVMEKLLFATLTEQRLKRRWGIFFKLVFAVYMIIVLLMVIGSGTKSPDKQAGRHTALVNLTGEISADGQASAEKINSALDDAFDDKNSAGIILRINSPGGSPVQAGMIYDEIKRMRAKHPEKQIYVVVEEMCASGGYYAAAAADKIFVDKASIVGSIGVLMDSFGFTGTMDKLGVERRLMTAGRNKGIGDPFSPVSPEQKEHLQGMLDEIHQQFIKVVRDGRGKRLKETPDTFSGLFWSGAKSIELGLADDYGTVDSVARDVIKAEDIVDYTEKENIAERFAKRFGASLGSGAIGALGRELHWR